MLAQLRVRNYALIDDLEVEFGPGLTVLTGETGAGKSIIVGALSLALGERHDATMLRTGADHCTIEARFTGVNRLAEDCRAQGIELDEEELIVRRRAGADGRSSAWLNDAAVTVGTLRRVGDRLVDLHGQHQHQLLLDPQAQLSILDASARLEATRTRYRAGYEELRAAEAELAALETEAAARRQRQDLTAFQARELTEAAVVAGEADALRREQELLASVERRHRLVRELGEMLSERDGSAVELASTIADRVAELAKLDPALTDDVEPTRTARVLLDELWRKISRYQDSIEFAPERADEVNARLFLLEKLERKYAVAADELPALAEKLTGELAAAELDESRAEKLRRDIESRRRTLLDAATDITRRRRSAGTELSRRVGTEFRALGLENARLEVVVDGPKRPSASDLGPDGIDTVEFRFSANPGEELKPLRRVASGGELSRIMLALKSTLARVALVPVMIFDEIDAGIGGRVAEAVGRRLARLGRTQQVICITHLPQLARCADHHFLIEKTTSRGRTRTGLCRLEGDDRVRELARMTAGAKVTETTLAHARELLTEKGKID
ncbi:MAG TPA: DNA repair protein RecN [candidate division WOR-3 bacterium]|uniref:DNA repair protein RecN n=1 Tax=candidate division WOR-3 bacterium TaxID=2052148 RepID=A0A7V0T6D8_UNCW3|nr:DNA repair protein RecN [candidate division WOR-3 bacterium]